MKSVELTVGLPMYRAKDIGWLAFESLIRQQLIDFEWELIIAEEFYTESMGEEAIMSYEDKLKSVGCQKIIYLGINEWIPLTQKWKMIGLNVADTSKALVLQYADQYSAPYRLASVKKLIESGVDWVQSKTLVMYELRTNKMATMSRDDYLFYHPCGAGMAVKASLAKKLPNSNIKKNSEFWFYHAVQDIKGSALEVAYDEINWSKTLSVFGLSNITNWEDKIKKMELPLRSTNITLDEILEVGLKERLLSLREKALKWHTTIAAQLKCLHLEITTKCQAQCICCCHDLLERRNKDMNMLDIIDIIKQAYNIGTREVSIHWVGEPTLHPNYSEILYEIKRKWPEMAIKDYTNGCNLANEKIRNAMIDNLDLLVISIDGVIDETMKKIRPGLDPNKIKENVKSFWKIANSKIKRPVICIRTTEMPENIEDIKIYKHVWQSYCDNVVIKKLQPRTDIHKDIKTLRPIKMCSMLWTHMIVSVEKEVFLCCVDHKGSTKIGDLNKQSLKEVWESSQMQYFRELHTSGRSNKIELCVACVDN